jgi:S-(hydroxymethyl)glutathione dehydrogenase/alcohol dehydrogenase
MKAAVMERVGAPLTIQEVQDPKPRQGEVLLKVAACGVCHSDLHVLKGEIAFPLPAVLGHEVSGTVLDVAPDVRNVSVGDRVVASFIMPCGFCPECARGRDDLCQTFLALNRGKGVLYDGETRLYRPDGSPLGMYSAGGFAQYAVVPATGVFRLPDSLSLQEACILGCAVPTAYGAVKHQGEVAAGTTVVVVGVGGVGSNIVQVARAFGAGEVIAVDIKDEALESAKKLGATQTINATQGDVGAAVRALTEGRGADVAFEALGRPGTIETAFNTVRDGGRVVVVGLAATGDAMSIPITPFVRRSISIRGSYGARMRSDVPDLLALAARGRIGTDALITRRFKLDEVASAYEALDKGQITGRAIVVME